MAGLLATGGANTVAADSNTSDRKINTQFDPKSKKEVIQFFSDLGKLSKKERIEAQESLNRRRAKTIIKVLQSTDLEIEIDEPENVVSIASHNDDDWDDESVTGRVRARWQHVGQTLYHLEFEASWEYDGDEIRKVEQNPSPSTYDTTWSDDGKNESGSWMNEYDTHFNCRYQHNFSYIGGGYIPSVEGYPYVEIEGDHDGNGEVVDKGGGYDVWD